jgi:hypothetical protein
MNRFHKLLYEVYQQLELDFRDIPKWAKCLGNDWDNTYEKRYYPIRNMQKGKQRDAAFKKFWLSVVLNLRDKGYSKYSIIDMGVPEYIFNLHH